jgi:uncharacterized protein (TIGR03083 family)
MIGSPPTPLAESVALFERSANYALEGLSGVTDADLDRPTPCTGWDLRKLVMHLADAADALTDLITTGKLSLPTPPRSGDAAPVIHRDTVLRKGDQTLWARNAAHGGAIEFAAHGWDIATACGAERQIPAGLATELLELSRSLINDQTRRPQFGPPVYISPTATANDRLVAFLGRQPASRS